MKIVANITITARVLGVLRPRGAHESWIQREHRYADSLI